MQSFQIWGGQVSGDTFYHYDMANCKSYSISNEPDANSAIYADHKNALIESGLINFDWDAYEWHDESSSNPDEKHPRIGNMLKTNVRVGSMYHMKDITWEKQSLNDFPLAGSVYRAVNNKRGDLLRFVCVTNCSSSMPAPQFER